MVSDRSQRQKPPYVSFKTFALFLDDMKAGVPGRIDRSYLSDNGKSGSTATQLLAALRFFNLVTEDGSPTPRLNQLAPTEGAKRSELLRQCGTDSYAFVFKAIVDPKAASYGQLSDAFKHDFGLAEDVVRKCAKFFISFAAAANIPLSPQITKKKLHTTNSAKTNAKTNKNAKVVMPPVKQNYEMPNAIPVIPQSSSWCQLCIETAFPRFDLNWPAEQQNKWFSAFRELVAMNPVNLGMPNIGMPNNRDLGL